MDLKSVEKTQAYWVLKELAEKVAELEAKVSELEETKADRRGPKPKEHRLGLSANNLAG